ncbi:Sec-independent protein translocase subunit TatA [Knoellia locipacati]|uniref:Sec-independent protein translocase protein TatA n=1 Tax=Knoellia locipacati TaxID=882824 RepID=A0A512T2R5_9MICO|nr:Sec-independent protein translocase subunit TatA [Knoellia locipacati]GEQ14535.1 Sec-independent protein translocase protein TatA [Knoellia locipacati]
MFGGRLGAPEIIIIAVLLIVIFGWKRLPDAARSLGRSARVFKSEVDEMKNDGKDKKSETVSGETVHGGPVRREADVTPTTAQGTTPIHEDAPRTDNVSGEQTGDATRKIV